MSAAGRVVGGDGLVPVREGEVQQLTGNDSNRISNKENTCELRGKTTSVAKRSIQSVSYYSKKFASEILYNHEFWSRMGWVLISVGYALKIFGLAKMVLIPGFIFSFKVILISTVASGLINGVAAKISKNKEIIKKIKNFTGDLIKIIGSMLLILSASKNLQYSIPLLSTIALQIPLYLSLFVLATSPIYYAINQKS